MSKKATYILAIILLFTAILPQRTAAQQDQKAYERTADLILQALNQGQSERIYRMTSEIFRSRMTAHQFATGMNRFKAKNGLWKTVSFHSAAKQGMDFTASFELSEQVLSLFLDSNGKLQRMNFREIPFTSR